MPLLTGVKAFCFLGPISPFKLFFFSTRALGGRGEPGRGNFGRQSLLLLLCWLAPKQSGGPMCIEVSLFVCLQPF